MRQKTSQRLLQDSLHEDATTAVASLLQRRRVLVAIHEASRLGRNEGAWEKKGTSPLGLGVSESFVFSFRDVRLFLCQPKKK